MKKGDFLFGSVGTGTEFLRTELLTGITRANIAQSTSEESKKRRNGSEARKAYDAVLRFLPQTLLSQEEKDEIGSKVTELKFLLQGLGEDV